MLEGLDQVDWAKIGIHVYPTPLGTEIPNAIRNLLAENKWTCSGALGFLFGEEQELGEIHDTTSHIIPFVIEILDEASSLDEILLYLGFVGQLKVYTDGKESLSIRERRNQINTYDALQQGIPIYLKYLDHPHAKTRNLSINLLSKMSDSAELVVPELVKHFDSEQDETLKTRLVEAVGQLLEATDSHQVELRNHYANWFRDLVENNPSIPIRVAAAKASIKVAADAIWKTQLTDKDVSPMTAEILSEAYLSSSNKYHERREIVLLLKLLKDPEPLFHLLENESITPDEAQILARGLLWNIFKYLHNNDSFWDYEKHGHDREINIYNKLLSKLTGKFEQRKKIFERILAVTKVWDKPTTQFSFFFGLPNSQEGLRELIDKLR